MLNNWVDSTNYDDKVIRPTYTYRTSSLWITLTRSIHLPNECWLVKCWQCMDEQILVSNDLESAKIEAIYVIKDKLNDYLSDLP